MSGLSVLIPAKNEEESIQRCLESVNPIASEIVVLDSYSEDSTTEICEEYGARVIQQEFDGFSELRERLLDAAQEEWVLFLDADEEVTGRLAKEIKRTIRCEEQAAYRVDLQVNLFGSWIGELGGNPIRFGPKEAITIEDAVVHETILPTKEYQENVRTLDGEIHHYTYSSISEYLNKVNQYTALEALSLEDNDQDPGFIQMLAKGFAVSVYEFTVKGGYKAGSVGVFFALISFQYRVITYFKHRELKDIKSEQPEEWRKQWIETECQRR